MNMGYEDDELKPYQEAQPDLNDQKRIGKTGTVQHRQYIHFLHSKFIFFDFEENKNKKKSCFLRLARLWIFCSF